MTGLRCARLALPLTLLLAGCDSSLATVERRYAKRSVALDPPALWTVSVPEAPGSTVEVCADRFVRESFSLPLPWRDGEPCQLVDKPVRNGDRFAARCRIGPRLYGVAGEVSGDATRDFTVAASFKSLDTKEPTWRQVRRYRMAGECPKGWRIGTTRSAAGRGDALQDG
jgi:hypothetical protein